MNIIERFARKFRLSVSGCLVWTAARAGGGRRYGKIKVNGRDELAHRWIYEQTYGPIPEHLEIDHICNHTLCVNPAHLRAITHKENMMRSMSPSAHNAIKTHCLRGHELSGDNVYHVRGERVCKACRRVRDGIRKRRHELLQYLPQVYRA